MNKKQKNISPGVSQPTAPTQGELPLEEQLARRQSGPSLTAFQMAQQTQERQYQQQAMQAMGIEAVQIDASGQIVDFKAAPPIGKERIREAYDILQKYKAGKANLEKRIIANELWYKQRHWECLRQQKKSEVEPSSGWLFNAIANKHADAMDNFPAPNILPREEGDKAEAQLLSSVIPVVLQQNEFEETYDNVQDYRLKAGTGVYGVFWDKSKLNGLGDISIQKIDLLNLFWESGITDIQKSRNLFHVELKDNDLLEGEYPELKNKLGGASLTVSQYIYDDTVDTTNKSAVVDWYYKVRQGGKTVLHYCKFVNDTVLFASENEEAFRERGWYDHGLYPFVFDPLFSVEGSPCGFSFIDVGKSAQEYIDRGNQAIMQNMLANARPRFFSRIDGGINVEEYLDMSKDIVTYTGNLPSDSIVPIQGKPLSDIYVQVINNKIEELKEVTGNRDVSTGGSTSGVTAASAIAAMQEAGSKLSRDNNKASYRAFRKVVLMVIELIRQFYDMPRQFRIVGQDGAEQFVRYSNAGLQPIHQGAFQNVDLGYRAPLFDIEVTAQKQSPYSKLSQNQMALEFYGNGFFAPQMADQALACLDMMDFDRKQFVQQKIAENGGLYQQVLMLQQNLLMMARMVDRAKGTNFADQVAAGITGTPLPSVATQADGKAANRSGALGGTDGPKEAASTENARKRVANSTDPT